MPKRMQLVVLDDDPTGIQTVHGCYVLTCWDEPTIAEALGDSRRFFYVLTNTRAQRPEQARRTVGQITRNVLRANARFGHELVFLSRSDSTLRSHCPLEIDTIVRTCARHGGRRPEALFLVPAFIEGGRVTAGDTHYVINGARRIPVAETEFARDSVFGYRSSHLPSYICEKTGGRVPAERVKSISLEMLRGPSRAPLNRFMDGLSGGGWVVVNAESYDDLRRFARAFRAAVGRGKSFALQCAASVVKALSGIADRPLLRDGLSGRRGGGLFIVGSHVRKTTAQLARLLEADGVRGIEVDVAAFVGAPGRVRQAALSATRDALDAGKTAVVYTSRRELRFHSAQRRLDVGRALSLMLASLVAELERPLAYVVAKGGITAHDVLASGLGVTKARVLGQVLPGVPVVRSPRAGGRPSVPCVIFPGNVGEEGSLREVLDILSG